MRGRHAILSGHNDARKAFPLRRLSPVPILIVILLASAACGSSGASGGGTSTAAPEPTATEAVDLNAVFHNFIYPIRGGCLPKSDNLMPNARRDYRSGIHEGVDFYNVDNCTPIARGTPIVAAKDGTVLRADWAYHSLTQAELVAADKKIADGHANDADVLDLFRGRQVWIDHGHGIVTRYAHLDRIADGVQPGTQVAQGEVIAYVGDSGTPESLSAPDTELHLHWELRAGDDFLGKGLPADDVRAMYRGLFEPTPR